MRRGEEERGEEGRREVWVGEGRREVWVGEGRRE